LHTLLPRLLLHATLRETCFLHHLILESPISLSNIKQLKFYSQHFCLRTRACKYRNILSTRNTSLNLNRTLRYRQKICTYNSANIILYIVPTNKYNHLRIPSHSKYISNRR